jgi:CHAD domain-containing protein
VLVETLDKVTQHFGDLFPGQAFLSVRTQLSNDEQRIRRRVLEDENAFASVASALRDALERMDDWAAIPDRWSSLVKGMQQSYRKARDSFSASKAEPTVETFHELRKQTKYLFYQLRLLRALSKRALDQAAGQAEQLGELLGDHHDLAILRQALTGRWDRLGSGEDRELLLALIDHRRKELEETAGGVAQRLFREDPQDLARRVMRHSTTSRA